MRRFILDTGIAGLYLGRKRGVFERAEAEAAKGNRVGVAGPVFAELAFRAEGSPKRERKSAPCSGCLMSGSFGCQTRKPYSSMDALHLR